MHLTKLIVLSSILIAKSCQAGSVIKLPKKDESRLVEATINLLNSCYKDRIITLGLVEFPAESIAKTLSFTKTNVPTILINQASRAAHNVPIIPQTRHKLQVFVITVANSSSLSGTLMLVKNSTWWNHMASFLLLDWPASSRGCSKAYKILWEAWKMNLLNSKFLCLDKSRGRLIYTFNPYTSDAPNPWKLEETYIGKNNHTWTLFVRSYQEYQDDQKICDQLDFDKTTNLGGYEIRASLAEPKNGGWTNPKEKPTVYLQGEKISAKTLMNSLNATWKFLIHHSAPWEHEDGEPLGLMAEIVNGFSDIGLNFGNAYFCINNTATYPHSSSGLIVMTQYRGHLSQLSKIVSVLDLSSRVGLFLVALITLLFFKYYLREPLAPAFMNLALVVCNSSVRRVPEKLAARIYLGSLFVFAVTIQGIYQGKLASLLTNHVPLPNVNSIEDLDRFDYTIYGHKSFSSCFNESAFDGRYVGLDGFDCTDFVLEDSKAACAGEMMSLVDDAVRCQLHLSRETIMSLYGVYLIRPDWPLEKRVNSVLQRCFEGDLIDSMMLREARSSMNALEAYENQDQDRTFKVIVLRDMTFAFAILGIGLGCSVLSFVVEVGLDWPGLQSGG